MSSGREGEESNIIRMLAPDGGLEMEQKGRHKECTLSGFRQVEEGAGVAEMDYIRA